MLRKDAKVELLKRVPLFERCSKRELKEIASIERKGSRGARFGHLFHHDSGG